MCKICGHSEIFHTDANDGCISLRAALSYSGLDGPCTCLKLDRIITDINDKQFQICDKCSSTFPYHTSRCVRCGNDRLRCESVMR